MQPFNSAWKAILGISILCFLNLCMAGLQWTLSICWDVGSSSSSFANRAGSQAESMAKEAGGRGGGRGGLPPLLAPGSLSYYACRLSEPSLPLLGFWFSL